MRPSASSSHVFQVVGTNGPGGNEKSEDKVLKRFLQDQQGQDLIEYTLLVAFVCLATAALFVSSGGSLTGIWITANSQLGAANTSAS